jgi:hypothetical protein
VTGFNTQAARDRAERRDRVPLRIGIGIMLDHEAVVTSAW